MYIQKLSVYFFLNKIIKKGSSQQYRSSVVETVTGWNCSWKSNGAEGNELKCPSS